MGCGCRSAGHELGCFFTKDPVRTGDWMTTAGGVRFWPLDPRPGDIMVSDIAYALSNICRWGGHSRFFISVAQHCVLVSHLGKTEVEKKWGLLHDATEAYIGDMVRPLKHFMPAYREVEDRLLKAVAERFELTLPWPAAVSRADEIVLASEAYQAMHHSCYESPNIAPNINRYLIIPRWTPEEARREWMDEYGRLYNT